MRLETLSHQAMGVDEILKALDKVGVMWLLCLFNESVLEMALSVYVYLGE